MRKRPVMGRLTPGEFLLQLNKLYDMNKEKGSVYVEMKRSTPLPLLCLYLTHKGALGAWAKDSQCFLDR